MLREAEAEGTAFGRQAKQYMDSGALLPDEIMLGIITERFAHATSPRTASCSTASPAPWVRPRACSASAEVDLAVNLEVPRDVVLERLSSRRVCTELRHHLLGAEPPTHPWTCDVCGGEVVQRADDTAEAIGKRLEAYERDTVPRHRPVRRARPARDDRRPRPARRRVRPPDRGDRRPSTGPAGHDRGAAPMMRAARSSTTRSVADVAQMRRAGQVVAEMHERIRAAVRPGRHHRSISTPSAASVLERRGATSNFLGYHGFPAVICASPNDMIVHGIPGDYRLRRGRHHLDRLRGHRRRLARRCRLHDGRRRDHPGGRRAHRRHRGVARTPASPS